MTTHPLPQTADAIAALIPHQGRMCLLDAVLDCDPTRIRCRTRRHHDARHPLRLDGRLGAEAGLEFAAQACALHGALNAHDGVQGQPGYIASARELKLHRPRLDDAPGELIVEAWHLAGDGRQASYRFALSDAEGRMRVEGRLAVVLDTPAAP